jgi:hypothetical protein
MPKPVGDGSAAAGEGGESNVVQELTVKLEDGSERKVTGDDALNLIKQGAEATQKTQQVASVLAACTKYDITPDKLVDQASTAFDVIHTLQQEGLIDDEGNVIKKDPVVAPEGDDNLFSKPAGDPTPPAGNEKVEVAIQKALGPLSDVIKKIETNQDYLARVHMEGQIKGANPDFSDGDVIRTLAMAKAKSIPVSEAIVVVTDEKVESSKAARIHYAKEFNVDLDEFDKNKLNQQDAEGGAAVAFKGKRFSFKGGKDTIDPKDAMQQHFVASGAVKQ